MRIIKCNECGKDLFETDKSDGAAGCEAQEKGFIFNMAFLYSDKYNCLFFCCKECAKSFYQKNIPKKPEIDKMIEEAKTRKITPEQHKEFCKKALAETIKYALKESSTRKGD